MCPLQINTAMSDGETSEFNAIIKYGSESGRLFKEDRVSGANGFEKVLTELMPGTRFVADLGGIEEGWVFFQSGMAPSFALVPAGQPLPPRPSQDHKQGFRMMINLGKVGGLREFCANAKTVTGAIGALYSTFEQAPEARAGKVPIVEFQGGDMFVSKSQYGNKNLFLPRLAIVGWIDRPASFGPRTVPPPGGQPHAAQPAARPAAPQGNGAARNGSRPTVAAPKAAAVTAPADEDWDTQRMTPPPASAGKSDDDLDSEIPF